MYLFPSADGDVRPFDVAVYPRSRYSYKKINPFSQHIDPMVFTLLFPSGDSGWTVNALNAAPGTTKIKALRFYSSRIAVRGQFNPIHYAGKLYQQYLIQAYCTVEAQRLHFIRQNQKQLRAECYTGLIDYLAHAAEERNLRPGNLVVLPATFVGGPRYMRNKYQDAMTIVRKFGKPTYFITFTCNPQWPEIKSRLKPYQDSSDRPDIVSRVFQLKMEKMVELITKQHILGKVIAFVYVIEFQKQGLPHQHALYWMDEDDKLLTADDVDRVISAELPKQTEDPELYDIILRQNIHGPCGEHKANCDPDTCHDHNPKCVCMRDRKCQKHFPKPFQDTTDITGDGYPKYRRRNNENEVHIVRKGRTHNGFVVPYNAYLSKTFIAHINVEMCQGVSSIKYLCKYFTKGHDRAKVALAQGENGTLTLDETKAFVDTRCVTPPEATWRLLENPLYEQSHTVYALGVHVENGQQIFFEEGDEEESIRRAETGCTTLTDWFRLNREDISARQHLYQDIPLYYSFKKGSGWKKRVRRPGDVDVIGRMAPISPRNVEAYHLRLLLLHVPGAESFRHLRTINDVEYPTYKEAALATGLIIDDQEWHRCMKEAAVDKMSHQLRSLFAIILIHCEVVSPLELWNDFRSAMTEDFRRHGNSEQLADNMALLHIQSELEMAGTTCKDRGIQEPQEMENVSEQMSTFDPIDCANQGQEMLEMLNEQQRRAADTILAATNANDTTVSNCFFIDGPGGTGKTFLYTALINVWRGERKKVIAVAWTGIAAILLPGGRTCHTAFRLPLDLDEESTCRLTRKEKKVLQLADIIIWDEASMAEKFALEAVDRTLRDLTENDSVPFGGKIIVLGGDFRQILPIVPGGSRAQIISHCIKSSALWAHFRQLRLVTNMRAQESEIEYATWLLRLGNDTLPLVANRKTEFSVAILPHCISQGVVIELFPDQFDASHLNMSQHVILSPFN